MLCANECQTGHATSAPIIQLLFSVQTEDLQMESTDQIRFVEPTLLHVRIMTNFVRAKETNGNDQSKRCQNGCKERTEIKASKSMKYQSKTRQD
jgi:hypothetical protein